MTSTFGASYAVAIACLFLFIIMSFLKGYQSPVNLRLYLPLSFVSSWASRRNLCASTCVFPRSFVASLLWMTREGKRSSGWQEGKTKKCHSERSEESGVHLRGCNRDSPLRSEWPMCARSARPRRLRCAYGNTIYACLLACLLANILFENCKYSVNILILFTLIYANIVHNKQNDSFEEIFFAFFQNCPTYSMYSVYSDKMWIRFPIGVIF